MVGVLTMAAAAASPSVKDYEIEPCKKRRKDDDSSSCETITKYLSPIGKTGDKVFSPPKPSNILHYFRKTSFTSEKLQSTKKCKVKPSSSLLVGNSRDCKTPLEVLSNVEFKKKGKRVNLSHQLNDISIESPLRVSSDDSKEDCSLSDFVESSTDVFLYKKHVEIVTESIQDSRNQPNKMTSKKNFQKINPKQGTTKNDGKMLGKRKHSKVLDLSESVPLADEVSLLKNSGEERKQSRPSMADGNESTADHIDSLACATKIADINKNTVTVSYEEFLKSHKADRVEEIPVPAVPVCVPSGPGEAVKSGSEGELSPQVHLKTVTVLAQVHPTSPKKKRKIPPIFLKQKQFDLESTLSDPENEQTVPKRRSNVVIQEGQLELAVLDAGSSEASVPKCSMKERQQFMSAFRQPPSEMLRSGPKKPLEKQKDPSEKSVNEGDNSCEKIIENSNIQIVSNHGSSQTHTNKASFPKQKSKNPKEKGKKTQGSETIPDGDREENMQKEQTSFSSKDKQKQSSLRRSLRQKSEIFKSNLLLNNDSLVCEDTAHNSLKMSLCDRNKSRKQSSPIREMVTPSKAEPEKRLLNISTPKPIRRSLRGSKRPATVTLGGTESEDAQGTSPMKASTPKAASMSEKHSLYTAELIMISSDSESPIRMKFTRISTPQKPKKKSKKLSKKSETTEGDLTSQKRKANSTLKNVSKAKQLIERAKAFQVSGSKAEETVMPLRRSSRHQILPEGEKSSETDDSVILIESSPTSVKQPEKHQKKLKNLNDVLGKKLNKPSKNAPGKMKIAPLFLAKKTKKTAIPLLDLDESSQDSSEQTQDCDVQFKAKRDFLMSGLPDLLKRQIAKKAAALDVYNAVSTSFQRVVHVQQKDDAYWLWHLKPPSCPLLTEFKDLNTKVTDLSKCVISLGEFSTLNSNPRRNSAAVLIRTRKDFTKEVKNLLLEEIKWSNPEFSLGKYFPLLLKKRMEHQILSEGHDKQASPQLQLHVSQKETKRKCMETGNQKSKRKKPNEYSVSPEKIKGKSEDLDKRVSSSGINQHSSKDSGTEDTLWTEKYQPQNSSELIGNELAIKKLHSWLKDWKRRAELEERQNLKGKRDEKQEDLSDSMNFKCSSDDEDEECRLCNTVLITGPTGVGKTAAVYACAQELGFKIFEVNASSQRSGRQILAQLKEATQSHQVDKQGVNSQKPCFFNNFNIGKSPKKLNSPGNVVTSPRKLPPSSPKGSGQKRTLPPKTLANYFKVSSKSKNNEEVGALMGNNKGIKNSSLEQRQIIQTKSNANNSNVKEFGTEESNRKNATSLILFEEVDVIFDEDVGFLNAVKTFMATTKRPVVLTTSDPTFSLVFDGCFEEINFNIPSLLNVASYLQVICLVENFRTDLKDFVTLLTANACDIRKSILYLQFWIRSGGGILEERPLSHCRGNSRNVLVYSEDGTDVKIKSKNSRRNRVVLPKCDTGCAEALFGLKNIASPSQDLFSFLKHKITTKEEWHKFIQLLTEFHMQNIDLLYSNLEFILPLPVTVVPEVKDAYGFPVTTEASAPGSLEHLPRMQSEDQPKKSQKRKQKKMVTLDDSDLFDTGLDFSDELTSLSPVPSSALKDVTSRDREGNLETQTQNEILVSDSVPQPPKTSAEKKCSVLVSRCLNSLTEFMENMSFIDALLTDPRGQNELGKDFFHWTSRKVKSGLCDEFSIESREKWAPWSSEELKATAEALSFTKCSSTISKALESLSSCKHLGGDPVNGLTFRVPQRGSDLCFRQSAANLDNADKRMAVIKGVFSSRSLLSVGNKPASVVDYLPALRNICRSEKLKEQGKNKRRFLHYFEGIHLDIPGEAVTALAADFP
ncbi:ATPase family AAA domain-containing protein 5 isoform X1 [Sigmodon hispidus]